MTPTVTIRSRRDGTTLGALLNGPAPQPGPYGGWDEVPRPRRKGFPDWTGQPLIKQTIPLRFDGYAADESVQFFVALLENMATADGIRRPPTVKVSGPIRMTSKIWVIEDIAWGDSRRNAAGVLTYQAFDLPLLEWDEGDVLKLRSAKVFRGRHGRSDRRTFAIVQIVKFGIGYRGENLMQLLTRAAGSTKQWQEVAKLNKISDPRAPLRVGDKIRLP